MSKEKNPWFKFWAFDWLSSPTIMTMTLSERGAFVQLLAIIWGSGDCSIPDDTEWAKEASGWKNEYRRALVLDSVSDSLEEIESIMGSFETVWDQLTMVPGKPGYVTHDKLWEQYEFNEKQRKNGRNGGRPRGSKNPNETQVKPKRNPSKSLPEPESEPKSESEPKLEKNLNVANASKKFVPPTVELVREYCQQRRNSVDPQQFINHYQANGWMRGKSKVKDWKACVRTWERTTSRSSSEKGVPIEEQKRRMMEAENDSN